MFVLAKEACLVDHVQCRQLVSVVHLPSSQTEPDPCALLHAHMYSLNSDRQGMTVARCVAGLYSRLVVALCKCRCHCSSWAWCHQPISRSSSRLQRCSSILRVWHYPSPHVLPRTAGHPRGSCPHPLSSDSSSSAGTHGQGSAGGGGACDGSSRGYGAFCGAAGAASGWACGCSGWFRAEEAEAAGTGAGASHKLQAGGARMGFGGGDWGGQL